MNDDQNDKQDENQNKSGVEIEHENINENSSENENENESEIEYEFNSDGEEDIKATIKKLRDKLKASEKEKLEYLSSWQRERADFINYKKSESESGKRAQIVARERFAEELLPVLDAYDMAFSNKEAWEKVDKNWRTGVEYIHQQLIKILNENGIEEISIKLNSPIDPNEHEAIETISTKEEKDDQTIAEVVQKGYKSNGKVFRPARVKVFEYKN